MRSLFEFRASLVDLEGGLELIHRSLDDLREATGREPDDRAFMLFEIALGEIGGNVLTHGRPAGEGSVDYELRFDGDTLEAHFSDLGPAAHQHLARDMPGHDSEEGRGLVLARSVLDFLGYERDGEVNRWRLVKKL